MRKFLLDMRKDFLVMSNFYPVEILGKPNSITIVTSKTNTQNEQLCAHFEYFFLKMRIRNLQCSLFYQPKVRKNEMVEQIPLSTNKICEEDPLADLNHSTKGTMTTYFCREYFP